MGWLNLPLQIAVGMALSAVMLRVMHLIGIA